MDKILEIKHLTLSYKGKPKITAIRDVSFDLNAHETLGIVGESGSGKSSIAAAIMNLLPNTGFIEKGEILFSGTDLLTLPKKKLLLARREQFGMIFQDPMTSLNPTMKIGKQIEEGLLGKKEFKKNRTIELLQLVRLSDPQFRYHQYPHELSGGQRQRVMTAIALGCNPSVLIADEPTTALDVTVQAKILHLLQEIQKETKVSILLITHNFGVVANLCDKVIVMYAGKIIETGKTSSILTHPLHPYTELLLKALPTLKSSKETKLTPIPGAPPSLDSPILGCSFAKRCPYVMDICSKEPLFFRKSPTEGAACHLLNNQTHLLRKLCEKQPLPL